MTLVKALAAVAVYLLIAAWLHGHSSITLPFADAGGALRDWYAATVHVSFGAVGP